MGRTTPAATAGTTGISGAAAPAGIPVQRLAALPGSSAARGSGTGTGPAKRQGATAAFAGTPVTATGLVTGASGSVPVPGPTPLGAPAPAAYQSEAWPEAWPTAQPVAPHDLAPVQRSTDGVRFSAVAQTEAFPVQRAVPAAGASPAAGTPYAPGHDRPVPLVAAAPVQPIALPVQRVPSTPSVAKAMSGLNAFLSPARAAAPVVTPVVAHHSANGGGSGKSGGDAADRNDPPPAYSAIADQKHKASDSAPATTGFDARKLKDEQVDELTHKLIGPLTRLLRTELRLDRERIGRLRDPRR
jgi:hypothetical protein